MVLHRRHCVSVGSLLLVVLVARNTVAQPPTIGGPFSRLEERRQRLVTDWVTRFSKVTGQTVDVEAFYDDILSLSTKTTFDAVTQALMKSPLTDASGTLLGDALSLVDHVDSVRGEVPGTSGDRQFRMYVGLTANARDLLERSREFKRQGDNSVYHKGYPLNYREQGGAPSIQFSVALDGGRADIDVDYRSSSFPAALFNGHLTAANSDVRAGDNADRHASRWTGFQNWWRGFFGVRLDVAPEMADRPSSIALSKEPRAGKKQIDVMVLDFLQSWLVEGDVIAAMGYISESAYACLAQDAADPSAFDRGMGPYQLLVNLKAAHDVLGTHNSLDGLTTGVRLTTPALKVVSQSHHPQFVIYEVPDDMAATFECESRLMPSTEKRPKRSYGNFFGSTFLVGGRQDTRVALLWAKDNGYWKIASWKIGVDDDASPAPVVAPDVKIVHVKGDQSLVGAATSFLETWLIRKDYDAAFGFLSARSYACYDLTRASNEPASASLDDAARRIRAGLERIGQSVGAPRNLAEILAAAEPVHPSIRVMDHAQSHTFALTGLPTALGDALECDARGQGVTPPDPLPLEYGTAFGMSVRFLTRGDDSAVLRLLWRREDGAWRIRSYDIEVP